MGSGKSSAGKGIAALLRWKFADLDKLVEEKEGMTVSAIFASRGEAYFRRAETEALRLVSDRKKIVVACGGGTPCSEENMAVMKSSGLTVYLRLPAECLVARLRRSRTNRPLLKDAGQDELDSTVRALLAVRSSWYEQAELILDAEKMTEEEMTAIIADAVRSKGAYL